jgi:hypothetical protein
MNPSSFYQGLSVKYKGYYGTVNFVSDEYITICINFGNKSMNDLCILVYEEDWKNIKLYKESNK